MEKRLVRSNTNKTLCGVLGGIGEYFDLDPTIIRVLFIILTVFSFGFTGIIAYILMALVIPKQ